MGRFDFAASIKSAEKDGLIAGGDYFKFKEGANRFRLVSECLPHQGNYKGTPNFKWLCYVLDRADGRVKTFFMPHTIYKTIAALQASDDYGFDEVPMPYDLTVTAIRAGTKEVEYTVVAARKNTELTLDEQVRIGEKKPLTDVKAAIRAKEKATEVEAPHDEESPFDPDDTGIPF